MKRITIVVDEDALEQARSATGQKTYSATINAALREMARMEILRDGLARLDHMSWWPGYVEEYGPNPPVPEAARNVIPSASRS